MNKNLALCSGKTLALSLRPCHEKPHQSVQHNKKTGNTKQNIALIIVANLILFGCSYGDFNVGNTNSDQRHGFVNGKRDNGIYLSVLGFGQGDYQDRRMQAQTQEATSALFPIAKTNELAYLKIRYKLPHENESTLKKFPIFNSDSTSAVDDVLMRRWRGLRSC